MRTILLLDDAPAERIPLATLLEHLECTVYQAASLADAFERLERVEEIDVALIDLMLPDGDGETLISHLLEHRPHTRIIVITGADEERYRRLALRPQDKVISKPVKVAHLNYLIGICKLERSEA